MPALGLGVARAVLRLVGRSVCLVPLWSHPLSLSIFLFLSSVLHFIFFLYNSSNSLFGIFSYNFIFHGVTLFPASYVLLKPLPKPRILASSVGKRAHFRVRQARRDVWSPHVFSGESLGPQVWASCTGQCHISYRYETGEASLDTGGMLGLFLRSQEVSWVLGPFPSWPLSLALPSPFSHSSGSFSPWPLPDVPASDSPLSTQTFTSTTPGAVSHALSFFVLFLFFRLLESECNL